MKNHYLDSSALVKRYLTEAGTGWIRELVGSSRVRIIMSAEITRVEVAAAIAARHRRSDGISRLERDRIIDLLLKHFDKDYRIVPLSKEIVSRAVQLTQLYRLRRYDAVQLATALLTQESLLSAKLDGLTFIAADTDLLVAASQEGLPTDNPNLYL